MTFFYEGINFQMMHPATLSGTISRVGYYRDTLPLLIINIPKEDAVALPYIIGKRIPISFVLFGETYSAGIRITLRSSTVMICPDLADASGDPVRLSDLLLRHGFEHNGKINIEVSGEGVSFS